MGNPKPLTIIDALEDPALFGALPVFRDLTSWRPWLAWLRAVYGLPMGAEDLDLFRRHTGRQHPREGGYPEACVIVGCQSGKSQIAALVGVYEAARAVMAGERNLHIPLIAQGLRGAQRALFSYTREAVESSDLLKREVVRQTSTTIELSGGVSLSVYPCRPAAIRGIRAACVVVDELAFFVSTDGRPTDIEMLRAVRTRVATTGGKVLVLSSPYAASGALWDLHRRHYGKEESPGLIWQASAPQMNPTLPIDYIERMKVDDPEAYRSEILGEFRSGLSTLLDPEALDAVVAEGVRERAPEDGLHYFGFADPSSGSGKDAFTLGIAHANDDVAVLDVVRSWKPPFNPSGAIAEASEVLKKYGLREVSGDRYAPGFVAEHFRTNGITYKTSDRTRSEIYLELLPGVNAARVLMLDDPEMLREFRGLERTRGRAGRDRVDHRRGDHDDRANASAGALVLVLAAARKRGPSMFNAFTGEPIASDDLRWNHHF